MSTKFRFYIIDLYDGCIKGTNDPETARECAQVEDCFVVDTETNEWLNAEGTGDQVEDIDKSAQEGPQD